MKRLAAFKAYDIRGRVPDELNEDIAYKIGVSFAKQLALKSVVVGYDGRLESPMISTALIKGLNDMGVNVTDIGLCGTEEVYFYTFDREKKGVDGGVMVTASHNPKGYNGMKMVQKGSRPVSADSGLNAIHDRVVNFKPEPLGDNQGIKVKDTDKSRYVQHLLGYVKRENLKPLKIVVDPGNGTAGLVIKQLEKFLPFEFIYIHEQVDGNFPNGVPNPLLPKNRQLTTDAVIKHQADFGIAWDGDFDRCFLFDENGAFIEGYYIVGLLAQAFLDKNPGEKIIHDPRLTWNTIDCVQSVGGVAIQSKTGHAFIKENMRAENAIYGGEMSAHHYFRDFAYCDSGMIPWLLVAELMSVKNQKLSEMVFQRMCQYPCSGEINYTVSDAKKNIADVEQFYRASSTGIDKTDGLSMSFLNWRFNMRSSNTEPLLRLNIESRGDVDLIQEKLKEIEHIIKQ
jgi:phosphomannomutase/phosphoglucomutase